MPVVRLSRTPVASSTLVTVALLLSTWAPTSAWAFDSKPQLFSEVDDAKHFEVLENGTKRAIISRGGVRWINDHHRYCLRFHSPESIPYAKFEFRGEIDDDQLGEDLLVQVNWTNQVAAEADQPGAEEVDGLFTYVVPGTFAVKPGWHHLCFTSPLYPDYDGVKDGGSIHYETEGSYYRFYSGAPEPTEGPWSTPDGELVIDGDEPQALVGIVEPETIYDQVGSLDGAVLFAFELESDGPIDGYTAVFDGPPGLDPDGQLILAEPVERVDAEGKSLRLVTRLTWQAGKWHADTDAPFPADLAPGTYAIYAPPAKVVFAHGPYQIDGSPEPDPVLFQLEVLGQEVLASPGGPGAETFVAATNPGELNHLVGYIGPVGTTLAIVDGLTVVGGEVGIPPLPVPTLDDLAAIGQLVLAAVEDLCNWLRLAAEAEAKADLGGKLVKAAGELITKMQSAPPDDCEKLAALKSAAKQLESELKSFSNALSHKNDAIKLLCGELPEPNPVEAMLAALAAEAEKIAKKLDECSVESYPPWLDGFGAGSWPWTAAGATPPLSAEAMLDAVLLASGLDHATPELDPTAMAYSRVVDAARVTVSDPVSGVEGVLKVQLTSDGAPYGHSMGTCARFIDQQVVGVAARGHDDGAGGLGWTWWGAMAPDGPLATDAATVGEMLAVYLDGETTQGEVHSRWRAEDYPQIEALPWVYNVQARSEDQAVVDQAIEGALVAAAGAADAVTLALDEPTQPRVYFRDGDLRDNHLRVAIHNPTGETIAAHELILYRWTHEDPATQQEFRYSLELPPGDTTLTMFHPELKNATLLSRDPDGFSDHLLFSNGNFGGSDDSGWGGSSVLSELATTIGEGGCLSPWQRLVLAGEGSLYGGCAFLTAEVADEPGIDNLVGLFRTLDDGYDNVLLPSGTVEVDLYHETGGQLLVRVETIEAAQRYDFVLEVELPAGWGRYWFDLAAFQPIDPAATPFEQLATGRQLQAFTLNRTVPGPVVIGMDQLFFPAGEASDACADRQPGGTGWATCAGLWTYQCPDGVDEPTEEECDGLDNDCDGVTDETCGDPGGDDGPAQDASDPPPDVAETGGGGDGEGCGDCSSGATGPAAIPLICCLWLLCAGRRRSRSGR